MKKTIAGLLPLFAVIGIAFYGSSQGYINADKTFAYQASTSDTVPANVVYRDLQTGDSIELFYNNRERKAYNLKDKKPVNFYVNELTGDTVYGRGRIIVNGYLVNDGGTWGWDTTRVKVEPDGEIKIKDGDKKVKLDEGKIKIKEDGVKLKADETEGKLKGPKGKLKVDDKKAPKLKVED